MVNDAVIKGSIYIVNESFIVRKLPNIVWNSSELEKMEHGEICISDRIDELAAIAKRYVSFDSWS